MPYLTLKWPRVRTRKVYAGSSCSSLSNLRQFGIVLADTLNKGQNPKKYIFCPLPPQGAKEEDKILDHEDSFFSEYNDLLWYVCKKHV